MSDDNSNWTDNDRLIFQLLLQSMAMSDLRRIKAGEVVEPHFTWYPLPPEGWRPAISQLSGRMDNSESEGER